MDGWDFKSYMLVMLFYRFISENIINYINKIQQDADEKDFNYLNLDDETALKGK